MDFSSWKQLPVFPFPKGPSAVLGKNKGEGDALKDTQPKRVSRIDSSVLEIQGGKCVYTEEGGVTLSQSVAFYIHQYQFFEKLYYFNSL